MVYSEGFDPNKIADAIHKAHINFFDARRVRDEAVRIRDYRKYQVYIESKFSNEKLSVEDRKAKAETDTTVIAFNKEIAKAQEIMDDSKAELERVLTKKEFMLDANATNRAELKLGGIQT